jgi:hypothetical protein
MLPVILRLGLRQSKRHAVSMTRLTVKLWGRTSRPHSRRGPQYRLGPAAPIRSPITAPSNDCQASAIAAIDTFSPGTFTGNLAPCRAGGLAGNHFKYSSFIP